MKKIRMLGLLCSIIKLLTGCSGSFAFNYGYNVKDSKVFYKNPFPQGSFQIPGADGSTLKIIATPVKEDEHFTTGYATDKNSVYYLGHQLPNSDGATFKMLNSDYSIDKNQCYYRGQIMKQADPATLKIKNQDYSVDKNGVYRKEIKIDNDPSIFQTFDSSSVVRTANVVSVYSYLVPLPAGATFTFLQHNYYAVNGQVYRFNDVVKGATEKGFKALDEWCCISNGHVFYDTSIIEQANPATFKQLVSPYAKDDRHVFFFERMIEGADPASFQILNDKFQCAKDKHGLYHEDRRIPNTTAADRANTKECIKCDEATIYFAEQ